MYSVNNLILSIVLLALCSYEKTLCQEISEEQEQFLENSTMTAEGNMLGIMEHDGILEEEKYDINTIDETTLYALNTLTALQIKQLLDYRKTMGNFISLYELQAIPGWDIQTIKIIKKKLKVEMTNPTHMPLHKIFSSGTHSILYRTGGSRSDTMMNGKTYSAQRLADRYRQLVKYVYELPQKINLGVTMEKDAGEKNMADHLSGFIALAFGRSLKKIIIGDYTLNMGQGLIQWQGYSMGMTSQITAGYRQGPMLRPHKGTDENKYHRGIALEFKKGSHCFQIFAGSEKIDANVVFDTLLRSKSISSFQFSGLHISNSELADKNSVQEKIIGGGLKLKLNNLHLGLNHLSTFFDIPVKKRDEPYNYYSMRGISYQNSSIDVSTKIGSGFLFGEAAFSNKMNTAFVMGFLKSLDPRFDLGLIYRNISKAYRSFQSNAFTQQMEANNERGMFINTTFKINSKSRLEAFLDQYMNPWPQYHTDGIRRGNVVSIQYNWNPEKKTGGYIRIQSKSKDMNNRTENNKTSLIIPEAISNLRMQFYFSPQENIILRQRTELSLYSKQLGKKEYGFMSYLELIYKPMLKPYSVSARITAIETGGYNSRIYAYERDLMFYNSIPALYGTGHRNYILLNYKVCKNVQIWLKWIYAKISIENENNNQAYSTEKVTKEWRLQMIWKS